jgi:hypothetical protein
MAFALLLACRLATVIGARQKLTKNRGMTNLGWPDVDAAGTFLRENGAVAVQNQLLASLRTFNFSGNISKQYRQIGVSVLGAVATAVNPILGTFYAIFVNIFRGSQDSGQGALVQDILDQVDMLISSRLADERLDNMRGIMESVLNQVRTADTSRNRKQNWQSFHTYAIAGNVPDIFGDCWRSGNPRCTGWRRSRASGNALLLEIHFAELLIASAMTVADLCLVDEFEGIVKNLQNVSRQITAHMNEFSDYRPRTLRRGFAYTFGTKPRWTWVNSSEDFYEGRAIYEHDRVRCRHAGKLSPNHFRTDQHPYPHAPRVPASGPLSCPSCPLCRDVENIQNAEVARSWSTYQARVNQEIDTLRAMAKDVTGVINNLPLVLEVAACN